MSAPSDRVPVALTDADIERVDGVHGPATGVPFLLIKGDERQGSSALVTSVRAALASVGLKATPPARPAPVKTERQRLHDYVHPYDNSGR